MYAPASLGLRGSRVRAFTRTNSALINYAVEAIICKQKTSELIFGRSRALVRLWFAKMGWVFRSWVPASGESDRSCDLGFGRLVLSSPAFRGLLRHFLDRPNLVPPRISA